LLHKKRRRLRSQADAILKDYQRGVAATAELQKLRASIRSLQQKVAAESGASSPVAAALKNLDASLGHLVQAQDATDGAEITMQFQAGLSTLSEAYRHAKQAGHDWTL
jgi:soluble cytochrome b562